MRRRQRGLLFACVLTASGLLASALWSYNALAGGSGDDVLATRLGLLTGFAGLLMAIWTLVASRRDTDRAQPLSDSADVLARRIRQQWEAAEDLHRLNHDYALSVSWRSEDEGLTERLSSVRAMAASWSVGPTGSCTTAGTDTLAGEGTALGSILREHVPTGRLVVLGDGGSGKTVLLERLVYDKLTERQKGDAVHVRFPLGSWPLEGPELDAWMASYLVGLEPTLAEAAPLDYGKEVNRAEALLRDGLVVPVLDGFDELPVAARADVLKRINDALRAGRPLILASRPTAYRAAVTGPDGVCRPLKGAAGITIQSVGADQAESYLRRRPADWDELCAQLGTGTPVGRALSTPLMLFLCRTVYEQRTGSGSTTAPAELCRRERFPTEETIRAHLFTAFLPTVYTGTAPYALPRWSAPQAERALRFLARHRRNTEVVVGAGTDLSWWRLHHLTPQTRNRVTWCLALASGALWLPLSNNSFKALVVTALMSTIVTLMLRSALNDVSLSRVPAAGLSWRWRWIPAGCGALLGFGVADSQVRSGSMPFTPILYVVSVLLFSLVGGAAFSWHPREADLDRPVTPRALLRQDIRTFFAYIISWTLAVTLVVALLLGLWVTFDDSVPLKVGVGPLLVAFLLVMGPTAGFGAAIGLVAALLRTACGPFLVACLWNWLLGRAPLRLLAFLEDAHKRGVLRQVGGSYEFRHVEIQQYLARAS